jgi:predicted secreted protein
MRLPWITALLAALFSVALSAQPEAVVYNRVNLSESAQTEVENDRLVVILSAQAEGSDAATPADEVNRMMDWAMSMLKDRSGLDVQTLDYRSDPVFDKETIRGWRVKQSMRIEGSDNRRLGDLIAVLQGRLQVQSIGYQVSEERRREKLNELTRAALERFQARAQQIAASLGRHDYRIVRIHIRDGQQVPMPVARGMLAEASAAVAPARLEAGTQQLTVSVNGEIELSED